MWRIERQNGYFKFESLLFLADAGFMRSIGQSKSGCAGRSCWVPKVLLNPSWRK
jgi:hypothetical protein